MSHEIEFSIKGQIGLVTLNRPRALNSLTLAMIKSLQEQLVLWKKDDTIAAVVIQAVPGDAFCAGGDVRSLYQKRHVDHQEQIEFFKHEYRLNHYIHHLGKPYIALMDGITMGGGVGVSIHGSYPIASERFVFAMPETGIGFFPDIGASHFLTRCPDGLGIYLGLTGNRLNASEAHSAGLVKGVVHSEQMPAFLDALTGLDLKVHAHQQIDSLLTVYSKPKELTLSKADVIKECFTLATVESIISALEHHKDLWAHEQAALLKQKSPFSLNLSLMQLSKAQGCSLAQCLQMDYTLVSHFMRDHDFYEGVRALLIDKDKNPRWNPPDLQSVTQDKLLSYFEPLAKPLVFDI